MQNCNSSASLQSYKSFLNMSFLRVFWSGLCTKDTSFLSILKIFIFDYRPTLKSKEVTLQILYHYVSPNIIIFLLVVIIPEVVAHFWSSQGCMQKREKDLDQIQLMQCWMLMHCNGHHDLCIQKVWSITISFYHQPPSSMVIGQHGMVYDKMTLA